MTDQHPITITLTWAEVLTVQTALEILLQSVGPDSELGQQARDILGKLEGDKQS